MRYSKRDGRKEWREKAKRSQEPKGRGELERWEGRGCFSWTFQSRITRVERVRHNKKSLAKKTEKKNISDSVSVWLVQRPVNKFPVHLLKTKGRPLYIHGHLLWSFGIASSVFPSLSALPPRDFRLGGANRKRKEDRISGLARERERERDTRPAASPFFPRQSAVSITRLQELAGRWNLWIAAWRKTRHFSAIWAVVYPTCSRSAPLPVPG